MMPELKLFLATIPAIGVASSITMPIFFHLFTLLPSSVMKAASMMIRRCV